MKKKMKFLLSLLTVFCFFVNFAGSVSAADKFRPGEKAEKWADKQLKKMTVDEKIGQLVHIGINAQFLSQDSNEYKELQRQIVDNKVGGIIVFVGDVYSTVHLVNRMQAEAKIPLLISGDFETGVAMRFPEAVNFPWNMAIAATGNPEFARRQGVIVGRESQATGVQQVFAPTLLTSTTTRTIRSLTCAVTARILKTWRGSARRSPKACSRRTYLRRRSIFPVTATRRSIRIAVCPLLISPASVWKRPNFHRFAL
jgi:hypothetical protein